MKEYPENDGELTGVLKIIDQGKVAENAEGQSIDDDNSADDMISNEDGDMPRPDGIVLETLKRGEVSNMVQ